MNAIATFRKCTLSDEDLISKVDKLSDDLFDKGIIPSRNIPARVNEDFDLLLGELLLRFSERSTDNTNVKKELFSILKKSLKPTIDNIGFEVDGKTLYNDLEQFIKDL